jgi:UDP-N-acetylmuramoyl-L-alanyl-D-glutamate--2,6-diaminopimelate ligase
MRPLADPAVVADTAAWLRASLPPGATLRSDSRRIGAGDAFFAYPGERADGRRHIEQAIERGAAAIVWDGEGFDWHDGWRLPHRAVPGLKPLCGPIASRYLDEPTARLDVVAVTGTNGKTSCTQWIAQGLRHGGRDAAVIGTLGAGRPGALADVGLTTPDALALQHLFGRLAADGVRDVAIEASSIGLEQGRLDGTRIAVAVYTNLSRDHLDHHGTMQAYAGAKAGLFGWPGLRAVVVNLDDAWVDTMLEPVSADVARIGYRIADQASAQGASARRASASGRSRVERELVAATVATDARGMRIGLDGDFGRATVTTSLIGRFNVENLLAVCGAWLALGMGFDAAAEGLSALTPVPGRLQVVPGVPGDGDAPLVVVDYAHTPDALANALQALRPVAQARGGRLWCVFGAGGDRDPGKRAEMGEIAERLADLVVLTSDNPRSESPQAILQAIRAGMRSPPAACEADRAIAIRDAVAGAADADVVLIAGKGHESYQEIGGVRHPFSDVDQASAALSRRAARGAGSGVR